jgi:DNA polymerase-3 subunit epsilon/ATP-dependent DNA helicase DinG
VEAVGAYRTSSAGAQRRQATEEAARELDRQTARAREQVAQLFAQAAALLLEHGGQGNERGEQLRVTPSVRTQPGWSSLETAWENADLALGEAGRALSRLSTSLQGLEKHNLLNYEGLCQELSSQGENGDEVLKRLRDFFAAPQDGAVYWMEATTQDPLVLWAAPLSVGKLLRERLFQKRRSVVLTSATLSTQGDFSYLRGQVGLEEASELVLGSPFNYRQAVLLCIPQDMPEPSSPSYPAALAEVLAEVAREARGHTLALFTSHAALRGAYNALRPALEAEGLQVLGQGLDGPPHQLLEEFARHPETLLLGTASFWEGVDISGGGLKVLVLARLPFHVPTDPLFAARAELFENSFAQFAVPQAVLRFRQGFGRLIRSRSDRGAVVVLDRRLLSRPYGRAFLQSIPPCTMREVDLRGVAAEVGGWLRR